MRRAMQKVEIQYFAKSEFPGERGGAGVRFRGKTGVLGLLGDVAWFGRLKFCNSKFLFLKWRARPWRRDDDAKNRNSEISEILNFKNSNSKKFCFFFEKQNFVCGGW